MPYISTHPSRAALILFLTVLFVGPAPQTRVAAATDGKVTESLIVTESLLGVIRRIDALRVSLASKRQQAEQVRDYLQKKQDDLVAEMRQRLRALGIDNYNQAMKDDRIRFDLRLYGHLAAYIDMVARRIADLDLGDHRLAFYFDRTDDDLRMFQTLNGLATAKLTAEMLQALDDYQKVVAQPLIDPNKAEPPSEKKLWPRIASVQPTSEN